MGAFEIIQEEIVKLSEELEDLKAEFRAQQRQLDQELDGLQDTRRDLRHMIETQHGEVSAYLKRTEGDPELYRILNQEAEAYLTVTEEGYQRCRDEVEYKYEELERDFKKKQYALEDDLDNAYHRRTLAYYDEEGKER